MYYVPLDIYTLLAYYITRKYSGQFCTLMLFCIILYICMMYIIIYSLLHATPRHSTPFHSTPLHYSTHSFYHSHFLLLCSFLLTLLPHSSYFLFSSFFVISACHRYYSISFLPLPHSLCFPNSSPSIMYLHTIYRCWRKNVAHRTALMKSWKNFPKIFTWTNSYSKTRVYCGLKDSLCVIDFAPLA